MRDFLKKDSFREAVMYLFIGGLTTLVGLGSYWLLTKLILDPGDALQLQAANCISWVLAVAFAYVTNRIFVFRSKNKNILAEAGKFCMSRLATLGLDMLFMFITVTLCGLNDKWMKLISTVLVTVANYILSKLLVFMKKDDPAQEKEDTDR